MSAIRLDRRLPLGKALLVTIFQSQHEMSWRRIALLEMDGRAIGTDSVRKHRQS